jgi:hypothetical protein
MTPRRSMLLALTLVGLSLGGCTLGGVLLWKTVGPPKRPAKFVPQKTPMVVLVENYQHQSSTQRDADILAQRVGDQLNANKVAPVIEYDKVIALRDTKAADYSKMSITSIGQALDAKQVLYVQLLNSDVQPLPGGEGMQGLTTARVRLVDVKDGHTLFPNDLSDGFPVSAATRMGIKSPVNPIDLRDKMYTDVADQVAKLFYAWTPESDEPEEMR